MKKIYLNGLKRVLTPRELKNVMGGSEIVYICTCHTDYGSCVLKHGCDSTDPVCWICTQYANSGLTCDEFNTKYCVND